MPMIDFNVSPKILIIIRNQCKNREYGNKSKVGTIQNPPYVFDISGFMNPGRNSIKTIVTTTLDRGQLRYPEPFIILNHDISENTGMYGGFMLYYD